MMLLTSSRVILYVGIRYNFSFFNVAKKLSIRANADERPGAAV